MYPVVPVYPLPTVQNSALVRFSCTWSGGSGAPLAPRRPTGGRLYHLRATGSPLQVTAAIMRSCLPARPERTDSANI